MNHYTRDEVGIELASSFFCFKRLPASVHPERAFLFFTSIKCKSSKEKSRI